MVPSRTQHVSEFSLHNFLVADCHVAPKLNRITRAAETLAVEPKVMEVLVSLASRHGDVVSKQELFEEVWPNTFVGEHVLTNVIWQLRRALGSAELIETVSRRGYRLTVEAVLELEAARVPVNASGLHENGLRRWTWVVLVLLVLGLVGSWLWVGSYRRTTAQMPVRRLAFLPLESTVTGESQQQFVAGISQSLRLQLLELHALKILSARTTSSLYENGSRKAYRELAQEARADAIAHGTAAVIGDRVQIQLEVWDAGSEAVLMSERFERDLKDILNVYGEIARRVAEKGMIPVADSEATRLGGPPVNVEGYRQYLMGAGLSATGRYHEQAIAHFKRCIELNEGFAQAYESAADQLRVLAVFEPSLREETRRIARKAVELDPNSARAAAILGHVESSLFWNWEEARKSFEDSERLRADHPALLLPYMSFLTFTRDCNKAREIVRREEDTDLASAWPLRHASWMNYNCGNLEGAINEGQAALARDASNSQSVHFHLAFAFGGLGRGAEAIRECEKASENGKCDEPWVLGAAGRKQEARAALDRWEDKWNRGEPVAYYIALGYMGLGDRTSALKWLNRSYEAREPDLRFVWQPEFAQLRDDRSFRELTCRLNLPPGVCGEKNTGR